MTEFAYIDEMLSSMGSKKDSIFSGFQKFDEEINGFERGSIIDLRGDTGSGKTSFVYSIIKKNMDKKILYIDTKHSFIPSFCIKNKIDLSKLYVASLNSIEKIYYLICKTLDDKMADIIVIDDIANILSEEDEMLYPGFVFKKYYKDILQKVSQSQSLLVIVNQNRIIDSKTYYIAQKSLNEICKYVLYFNKESVLRYRNEYIGCKVKIKIKKPAVSNHEFFVNIFYNRGIDEILNLINILLEKGKLQRRANWILFGERVIGNGVYDSVIRLNKDENLKRELENLYNG